MVIEKIDYNQIKQELEQKLLLFEKRTRSLTGINPEIMSFLEELKLDIKILYSIFLELKQSHSIDNFSSKASTNILLLKKIDPDFINNLQILSSRLSVPNFKLLNILMRNVLQNVSDDTIESGRLIINHTQLKSTLQRENNTLTISHKDFVEITNSDLEDFDIKYNLCYIDIVILKELTVEKFISNVGRIEDCKSVFIPKSIPKLLIFSKVRNIENLQLYDSLEDVYDLILIFK